MHIGICEDSPHDLTKLIKFIEDYPWQQTICLQIFHNADDLLLYLANPSNNPLHCLLIDIVLPSITGMEAAQRIRQHDDNLPIIFTTSSPEFAVDSYRIRAFDYLLKPYTLEDISKVFNRLNQYLNQQSTAFFILKTATGLRRIEYQHLLYVEALGRDIIYTLHSGETITTRDTLAVAAKLLLDNPKFIKPHRSYIVNLASITYLCRHELLIKNNKKIPLARSSYEEVKKRYLDFSFE